MQHNPLEILAAWREQVEEFGATRVAVRNSTTREALRRVRASHEYDVTFLRDDALGREWYALTLRGHKVMDRFNAEYPRKAYQ